MRDAALPDNVGFSGKRWPQTPADVEAFVALLVAEGVRSYLEIGCRYGDTFHAVGSALPAGSRLVACDLPDARNGRMNIGRHPESEKYLRRAALDLCTQGKMAQVVIGDSHAPEIIEAVRRGAPFDAILIDGDHTPAGARADWDNFAPMGRIIALHDIFGDSSAARGPKPLFKELKAKFRHQVIGDGVRRGFGIIWRDQAA